jgi:hypothetical protein
MSIQTEAKSTIHRRIIHTPKIFSADFQDFLGNVLFVTELFVFPHLKVKTSIASE